MAVDLSVKLHKSIMYNQAKELDTLSSDNEAKASKGKGAPAKKK